MRAAATAYTLLFIWALLMGVSFPSMAQPRHSQVVLEFPEERPFSYRFEPADRALVIEIQKTHPQELEALFHYDETIIRRVFFKDLGGQAAEARLVLRDDAIRVLVHSFQEPFRISIDFFDENYREGADPLTGLPLIPLAAASEPTQQPSSPTLQASPAVHAKPLQETAGKRRLLQPDPASIRTPQELVLKLSDASGGIGQCWKTYPPYIYRIQTSTLKTGKSYEGWMKKNAEKAMSSSEAMAQYAGQLFDFGHESRALLSYQKLLHEDPSVFDRNAEAIWKLAEIHLGQGSLTLADGYYESLQSKHPDHPLSNFSALRRLDIKAIRASKEGKAQEIAEIGPALEQIQTRDNPALNALIALRRAYWQIKTPHIQGLLPAYSTLPKITTAIASKLDEARNGAESPRTSFLIDSIILSHQLAETSWNPDLARFSGGYFDRYKGSATEPYRAQLIKGSESSILKTVDKLMKEEAYASVIAIVESLPASLAEIKNTVDISWAAAESYRRMQQPLAALPYYETAAKKARNKPDQFRANFWHMQSTMLARDTSMVAKNDQAQLNRLQKALNAADRGSWESWQALTNDERTFIFAEIKAVAEDNIKSPQMVKTSPKILLEMWSQRLSTDTPTPGSSLNAKADSAQPTSRLIYTLADLSKRFEQLGLNAESRSAKLLQKRINLKSAAADKDAMKVWTDELTLLAEEMRKSNDLLEAGRLYALAGSENNQWDGRAEALYKGGLLLYRSGRREEAIAAFEQAANDGNNLLYAELAKKRLEQLQQ